MQNNLCREKAQNIITICRTSGVRAEPLDLLRYEAINVALARALGAAAEDEALLDAAYEQALAPAQNELVTEFVAAMRISGENGYQPDYHAIVDDMRRIEEMGGRGAYEPRTVAGESILLTTALALVASQYVLVEEDIRNFVEWNRVQVAENLRFALEIY